MKRLIRNDIKASYKFDNAEAMFTAEDVVELLLKIDELKNCKISLIKNFDGSKFTVGDCTYICGDMVK